MVNTTSFSILIPLIALIVIELSGVSREIDLRERRTALRVGIISGGGPPLGRLNIIHLTNTFLLTFGVSSAVTFLSPEMVFFSTVPLGLIWIILPVLEVGNYGQILKKDYQAKSFGFHFLATLVVFSAYTFLPIPFPTPVFSTLSTAIAIFYLYLLDHEIPSEKVH